MVASELVFRLESTDAPIAGAWVYIQQGASTTVLRTDDQGIAHALVAGKDPSRPWEHTEQFLFDAPQTQVSVLYSRGARPIPDLTLKDRASSFFKRDIALSAATPRPAAVAPNKTNPLSAAPQAIVRLPDIVLGLRVPAELSIWPLLWEPIPETYYTDGIPQGESWWGAHDKALAEQKKDKKEKAAKLKKAREEKGGKKKDASPAAPSAPASVPAPASKPAAAAPAETPKDEAKPAHAYRELYESPAPGKRPKERGLLLKGVIDRRAKTVKIRVYHTVTKAWVKLRNDAADTDSKGHDEVTAKVSATAADSTFERAIYFLKPADAFGPIAIVLASDDVTPNPIVGAFAVHLCGVQGAVVNDWQAAPDGTKVGPIRGEDKEVCVVDFTRSPSDTAPWLKNNPKPSDAELQAARTKARAAIRDWARARRMVVDYIQADRKRALPDSSPTANVVQNEMPMWMAELHLCGTTKAALHDLLLRRKHLLPAAPATLALSFQWKMRMEWLGPDHDLPATRYARRHNGEETADDLPVPKPAANKPAGDKDAAGDKGATGDKAPASKPGDKPAADKPAADKPAADKPAADKPAADKPAADKPSAAVAAAADKGVKVATEPKKGKKGKGGKGGKKKDGAPAKKKSSNLINSASVFHYDEVHEGIWTEKGLVKQAQTVTFGLDDKDALLVDDKDAHKAKAPFTNVPVALPFPCAGRRAPAAWIDGQKRPWGRAKGADAKDTVVLEWQVAILGAKDTEVMRGGNATPSLPEVSVDSARIHGGLDAQGKPFDAAAPDVMPPALRVHGKNVKGQDLKDAIAAVVNRYHAVHTDLKEMQSLDAGAWRAVIEFICTHESGGGNQFYPKPTVPMWLGDTKTYFGHQFELPYFGGPRGYGIGQKDPCPRLDAIFDYIQAVDVACEELMRDKVNTAVTRIGESAPFDPIKSESDRQAMLREAVRRYNGGSEFIHVGDDKTLAIRPGTSPSHYEYPNKVLHTKVPYSKIFEKGSKIHHLPWGKEYFWKSGGGGGSDEKPKDKAPRSDPPKSSLPKSDPPKSEK